MISHNSDDEQPKITERNRPRRRRGSISPSERRYNASGEIPEIQVVKELTVIVPDEPPRLTPPAAKALLQLLVNAAAKQPSGDATATRVLGETAGEVDEAA